MRKVAGICVVLFILLAPVFVSAQSFFGFGLPFLGSSGYGCDVPRGFLNSIFYIGWGEDQSPTSVAIEPTGSGILGGDTVPRRFDFRNHGLWLGLSEELWLFDRCGVLLSGWWLVPTFGNTRESLGSDAGKKDWDDTNRWWYVDGALALNFGGCGSLLGGFRYDYNTATFTNPHDVVGFNPTSLLQADVITSNLIPYIGIQTAFRSPKSSVTARIIGFPTVGGWLKYSETNVAFADAGTQARIEGSRTYSSGYFLETLLEGSCKPFGDAEIGGFLKWTGLHTRGTFNATGALAPALGSNADFDYNFYRQIWVVGGKIALAF